MTHTLQYFFFALTLNLVFASKDARCFPPTHVTLHPSCVQDETTGNPNFDCRGGHYVQTSGIFMPCATDSDCTNNGEPNEWCNSEQKGYQWTIVGCHCDLKLNACVVQRYDKRINDLQWAYCTSRHRYQCEKSDYCSPPNP